MTPRRGVDFSFIQGVVAVRARAAVRSKKPPSRPRTKRHDRTASSSSSRTRDGVGPLSLFGWQTHRASLSAPATKKLDLLRRLHGFFSFSSPAIVFNPEPSAPEWEPLAFSAPSFTGSIVMPTACAPPLTPSSATFPDPGTNAYVPSAPMLTPTCLWTNVQWSAT